MNTYFKSDKRFFALFSALQLSNAKFYRLLKNKQINDLTKKLRVYFKQTKIRPLKKLEKYFREIHPYFLSQWILHHGLPPLFKRITKEWQLEASLKAFKGFNGELGNFYGKTRIEKLFWHEYKRRVLLLKTRYLAELGRIFSELRRYLRTKRKFSKIVIIPNLFDAISSGYGIEIGDINYVIFSPADRRADFEVIIHEFLHNLVEVDEKKINDRIIKKLAISKQAAVYYKNKEVILTEYLVRAITGRFFCKTRGAIRSYIDSQIKKGFINIKHFLGILGDYEKQRRLTFDEYLNEILIDTFS